MRKKSTSDRLKEIMLEKNLKQIEILKKAEPFCKKYGIKLGRNDLSQYISGKVEPSQKKLTVLAEALDTNEVWLMGYDVPMNKKNNEIILDKDDDIIITEGIGKYKKGDIVKSKDLFDYMRQLLNQIEEKKGRIQLLKNENEKMNTLNKLFEDGKISYEEFCNKKLKILNNLLSLELITNEEYVEIMNNLLKH